MEFKLSKKEINDLLKQWIIFRDEELSTLTKENKKHPLSFDEFEEKLIKSLPYKNRDYTRLDTFFENFFIFMRPLSSLYYILNLYWYKWYTELLTSPFTPLTITSNSGTISFNSSFLLGEPDANIIFILFLISPIFILLNFNCFIVF